MAPHSSAWESEEFCGDQRRVSTTLTPERRQKARASHPPNWNTVVWTKEGSKKEGGGGRKAEREEKRKGH